MCSTSAAPAALDGVPAGPPAPLAAADVPGDVAVLELREGDRGGLQRLVQAVRRPAGTGPSAPRACGPTARAGTAPPGLRRPAFPALCLPARQRCPPPARAAPGTASTLPRACAAANPRASAWSGSASSKSGSATVNSIPSWLRIARRCGRAGRQHQRTQRQRPGDHTSSDSLK